MSDQFDRARDIVTPWERAEVDSAVTLRPEVEALRDDAARSMVVVVLRKRQEREARTARRELVAVLILDAALVAFVGVALLAPTGLANPAVTAAVLTAGMLLGLNLRSRL